MMATDDDDNDGGLGASHGSLTRAGSAHPPQPPPPPNDGGGGVDDSHRSLVNACYAQRSYGESQYVRYSGTRRVLTVSTLLYRILICSSVKSSEIWNRLGYVQTIYT